MRSSKTLNHNRQQNELVSIPMRDLLTAEAINTTVQKCLVYFGLIETTANLTENILDTMYRYNRGVYNYDTIVLGLSSVQYANRRVLGDIHANYTVMSNHRHKKLIKYVDVLRPRSLELDKVVLMDIFGMNSSIADL